MKRYEKELWTESSHMVLYSKNNLFYNPYQMRVFAALFAWRDRVAREEDESTRFATIPFQFIFVLFINVYVLCFFCVLFA